MRFKVKYHMLPLLTRKISIAVVLYNIFATIFLLYFLLRNISKSSATTLKNVLINFLALFFLIEPGINTQIINPIALSHFLLITNLICENLILLELLVSRKLSQCASRKKITQESMVT